jgi:RNA polymerase sigma-70 factor (ECF subfamily)
LSAALARVATGDSSAFAGIYAATSAKLLGVIVRIVGRRDVAEDVLQDVYLSAWQRAANFDPSLGSPITWLCAIARNRALDEIRRKAPLALEDCPEHLDVASNDNACVDLVRSEDDRCLNDSIERMAPEKRLVLRLAYEHGLTRDEIAARIGRPVGTVKSIIRRGLAELQEQIAV